MGLIVCRLFRLLFLLTVSAFLVSSFVLFVCAPLFIASHAHRLNCSSLSCSSVKCVRAVLCFFFVRGRGALRARLAGARQGVPNSDHSLTHRGRGPWCDEPPLVAHNGSTLALRVAACGGAAGPCPPLVPR